MTVSAALAIATPEVITKQLLQLGHLVSDLSASTAVAECAVWTSAANASGDGSGCQQVAGIFCFGPAAQSCAVCRASTMLGTMLQV